MAAKKKTVRNLIIFAVIIVAVVVFVVIQLNAAANRLPVVETMPLAPVDLVNSLSVTGTVESEEAEKIYSRLTYPVKETHVEVGDIVKAGDILCELDMEDLESNIEQQKAAVSSSAANNAQSITTAQLAYRQALDGYNNGNNASIIQAEQGVLSAQSSLDNAEAQLKQAELVYMGSVDGVQYTRKMGNDISIGYSTYTSEDSQNHDMDVATNSRDKAYESYQAARTAVESAKANLKKAEETRNAAVVAAGYSLETYLNQIRTAQVAAGSTASTQLSIEKMERDLEKGIVSTPVGGVVTAVYVNKGATSATGTLMYVIEDVGTLKVSTSIKEYDIAQVKEGDVVEIKSDATGEEIFDGKMNKISPTTTKTATGDNVAGGNGEFSAEVGVTGRDSALRIGTKARLEIILEQKDQVMAVPYEALFTDAQGGNSVYVLEHELENIYVVKAIPVELGMETDFYVEVSSPELDFGAEIVSDVRTVTVGSRVSKSEAQLAAQAAAAQGDGTDATTTQIG
ncbi:MAG: efflux RND transporter periplasmic adaptor subunit [Oscillospiraceae bacterium]